MKIKTVLMVLSNYNFVYCSSFFKLMIIVKFHSLFLLSLANQFLENKSCIVTSLKWPNIFFKLKLSYHGQ